LAWVRDAEIPTSSPDNYDSHPDQDEDISKEMAGHLFFLFLSEISEQRKRLIVMNARIV